MLVGAVVGGNRTSGGDNLREPWESWAGVGREAAPDVPLQS